jgi:hypothetical protein
MSDLNNLFEDPSAKVEHFESTYAMLKSSPDVEPPRRIMFEFEKPKAAAGWLWRWLGPMTAAAAVAFAVVTFTPRPQAPPQQADYKELAKEIQRVRGEMDEIEAVQRAAQRENIKNAAGIQQLAALTNRVRN